MPKVCLKRDADAQGRAPHLRGIAALTVLGGAFACMALTPEVAAARVAIDRQGSSGVLIPGERAVVAASVPRGQFCRLTVARHGAPRSSSVLRRATGNHVAYSWVVAPGVGKGTWTATIRCSSSKRALLSGRGLGARVSLRVQRLGKGVRGARVGGAVRVVFRSVTTGGKGADITPGATPGWAEGGTPNNPHSQRQADERYAVTECAHNTALLFRVRGSGEEYGQDILGHWTYRVGEDLIAKGWRVRDMQAVYSAPKVPLDSIKGLGNDVVALNPQALKRFYMAWRDFRDVATRESNSVSDQLERAYRRCKKRTIFISGYSQGGIVLRYVVPSMTRQSKEMVGRIDLIADPTTDLSVDANLDRSRAEGLPIRRVQTGSDTASGKGLGVRNLAGKVVSGAAFKQTPYPAELRSRTTQFCLPWDYVCDANLTSIARLRTSVHLSYDTAAIGRRTASFAKTWASPPPPPVPPPSGGVVEAPGPSSTVTTTPSAPAPPRTFPQQQATRGVNTFTNPYNASGMGERIPPRTWVQVSCKVHAPQIVSVNPDGYWYRIASAPWNNAYYAPANTFWNGDVEGQLPYTRNTDWNVPNC